ncbi:MAG: nucleotidyl transferase AbiEii/AbiGii toxin family protein [Parachlamydiales bacterium]|nr:nucleotidyl transferase AbiEii/AbiGii toxin family protein [Parachlamydiales bacterium]
MDDTRKYRFGVILKPLRKRLEKIAQKTGLRLDIVQQDYLLSWLLVGIYQQENLKSSLLFKGGTALKKGYFGNYRFSEDLDFSIISKTPIGNDLMQEISNACKYAENRIHEFAPIKIFVKRYKEKSPHPQGQEAFKINAQFPWQSQPLTTAMIEISREETIVFKPVVKGILHNYEEIIEQNILIYSLEEIILEKLRAILQHIKKLHERDWTRSRARDYMEYAL